MSGEDKWTPAEATRPRSLVWSVDDLAAAGDYPEQLQDVYDEIEIATLERGLDRPLLSRHASVVSSRAGDARRRSVSQQTQTPEFLDDLVGDLSDRPTTYSSLPPSPRVREDYPPDARPLSIETLHEVFKRLDPSPKRLRPFGGSGADEDDTDRDDSEETFWPARSRRQTLERIDPPRPILTTLPLSPQVEESVHSPSMEPDNVPSEGGGEGLSLWDLLRDDDAAEQWEGWIADGKWERIANFLAVPLAVEKVTLFGALLCLDGFLYNFTILPIRSTFAAWRIFSRLLRRQPILPIPPSHLQSLLRLLLISIPAVILLAGTDASKMYHAVRGQDTIKLYVIFNALEIGDRLCCAFGQDVLDTLFARDTLSSDKPGRRRKREHARPVFFFTLSLGYVLLHTLVFFYMLISLNVAINSYDYTLISLLISNQFVEIKGSVFKKFEKENLFQIMCADVVERFQLGLMLVVIAIRNMIEMSGSELAFLPTSFIRGNSLLERILSPVLFVLASEMIVDWLKHGFIAKFNHVRATVYGRFIDVLAKDVLLAGTIGNGRGRHQKRKHPILLDQSPLVSRRLGIASIPLAVLVIRIGAQAVGMLMTSTHAIDGQALSSGWLWTALKWTAGALVGILAWGCLVVLKVLLGLGLLSYSALRQSEMDEREAQDKINNFGRPGVGQSKEEIAYEKETTRYLSRAEDDLPDYPSAPVASSRLGGATPRAQNPRMAGEGDGGAPSSSAPMPAANPKKKSWRLEEVERWTMVKRIW